MGFSANAEKQKGALRMKQRPHACCALFLSLSACGAADLLASPRRTGTGRTPIGRPRQAGANAYRCKKPARLLADRLLCWRYLFLRPVARQLSSAKVSLTSVFGMGTGGPSLQSTPTDRSILHPSAVVNYIFPLFSLPLMFFRQAADRDGPGSHNPGQRPASPAPPPGPGGSGYTAAFPRLGVHQGGVVGSVEIVQRRAVVILRAEIDLARSDPVHDHLRQVPGRHWDWPIDTSPECTGPSNIHSGACCGPCDASRPWNSPASAAPRHWGCGCRCNTGRRPKTPPGNTWKGRASAPASTGRPESKDAGRYADGV